MELFKNRNEKETTIYDFDLPKEIILKYPCNLICDKNYHEFNL